MATVKENLLAAKALIDTPEKWTVVKSAAEAIHLAVEQRDRDACLKALADALDRMRPTDWADQTSVLERFDRAIAAQPEGEAP